MNRRKPVFTVLSLLVALVFALGSRPFLIHSFDQQLADASPNSADAIEDSGRMAGFALIAGQVMLGGIGAAIGVVLAVIGFGRREKWQAFRWGSLVLNLFIAASVGATFIPLWWSQHRKTKNNQPNKTSQLTPDPPPVPAVMAATPSARSRSLAHGQAQEDSTLGIYELLNPNHANYGKM